MNKKQKVNSTKKSNFHPGILVLENKSIFNGIGIGYQGIATGEICFNTSITGYQEIISDPSYAGQIINFTFPHIGNVGTNKQDNESDKVWTKGVIFNSEITDASNYRSLMELDIWLRKNKIIGLIGLDTRSLTNLIRDRGAPRGTTSHKKSGDFNVKKLINTTLKWPGLNGLDLAKNVSTKKKFIWKGLKTWTKEHGYKKIKKKKLKVVAIDYGIKTNILRYFSNYYCDVIVVPCQTTSEEILSLQPSGIFLSNGPGDPAATSKYSTKIIKNLIKKNLPVFGICLGHQLLALALGGKTKKMKLGHRGANHPVKNLVKDNVEITSQNHGFEIVKESLPKNIEVTHRSLFDECIEGIRLKKKPIFSVQYHPESNPGPQDSVYLFQEFINNMKKNAKKKRS